MEWGNIETLGQKNNQTTMTGWSIKNVLEDKEKFKAAQSNWVKLNGNHQLLGLFCTK